MNCGDGDNNMGGRHKQSRSRDYKEDPQQKLLDINKDEQAHSEKMFDMMGSQILKR